LKGTQTVTAVADADTFTVAVDTSGSTNTVGGTSRVQLKGLRQDASVCIAMNLLFWGEVVKTPSNNTVKSFFFSLVKYNIQSTRTFKNPLKLPSPPPHKGSSCPASPLSLSPITPNKLID
jgi:hypothetical protein